MPLCEEGEPVAAVKIQDIGEEWVMALESMASSSLMVRGMGHGN